MDCSQRQTATASNILSNQTKPIQTKLDQPNRNQPCQNKQERNLYIGREQSYISSQNLDFQVKLSENKILTSRCTYSHRQKYAAPQLLLQIHNPFLTAVISKFKMNIFHNHATLIIQGGFILAYLQQLLDSLTLRQNKTEICPMMRQTEPQSLLIDQIDLNWFIRVLSSLD